MKSVYELKPKFLELLAPAMHRLRAGGWTPNGLTAFALFLSGVAGAMATVFLPENPKVLWIYPGVLFLRMALNALDGLMAREYSLSSKFGHVFNEVSDVLSDLFLYGPLMLINAYSAVWVPYFLCTVVLVEFSALLAQVVCGVRAQQGPMGKSDRALVLGLVAAAAALGAGDTSWFSFVWWVLIGLALVTAFNRLRAALR